MDQALEALGPCPAPVGSDPDGTVEAITRRSRSSFALGMALLPPRRRAAIRAVYAFARVIDDIADGPWPAADKRQLLAAWREEIERLYRGRPVSAVGMVLEQPVRAYGLPRDEFLELIAGMEMDAAAPIIAPPMAELRLYCRRVAGAVGLLAMRIFGADDGTCARRFALALGDALQFTNILRDVRQDARAGRLYLPLELLDRHGVPTRPEAAVTHPALPNVCRSMAALARLDFETARAAARAQPKLPLAPALAMMGSYEAQLSRLAADGFAPGGRIGRTRRIAGSLGRLALPGMRSVHV